MYSPAPRRRAPRMSAGGVVRGGRRLDGRLGRAPRLDVGARVMILDYIKDMTPIGREKEKKKKEKEERMRKRKKKQKKKKGEGGGGRQEEGGEKKKEIYQTRRGVGLRHFCGVNAFVARAPTF